MSKTTPTRVQRVITCMFAGSVVRENVDPVVKELWEARQLKAPFGDLRRTWKTRHCRTLNPYGSASCPYSEQQCAQAFLEACQEAVQGTKPIALFWHVARRMALERADEKPLERERMESAAGARDAARSAFHFPAAASDPVVAHVADEGESLSRARSRPQRIGALLRAPDAGSRTGPADDGEKGAG